MKIRTILLALFLVILLVIIAVIYYPQYKLKQQQAIIERIKANDKLFTTMVIDEFSKDDSLRASDVAQKVCDSLNKNEKNPYDSKALAFSFDSNCKGCHAIEFDNKLNLVILTTYDKKGELMARTVIKPPSFVTYFKD